MKPNPPQFALRFLRWFCREDYLEEVEGDLIEVFEIHYDQSPLKAKRKFCWSVVKYFRPEFIKAFNLGQNLSAKQAGSNTATMVRHNFLLAFRNFNKYKGSFFINLIGLSTGLACALTIFLWVQDELRVDKFHEMDEQLYQVMQNMPSPEGIKTIEPTPDPLANALVQEMPEVDYAVTVVPPTFNASKGVISAGDKHIRSSGQYVSDDFFELFSFKLLHGNKKNALSEKNGVVISEKLALKLFKSAENALGKTIDWKAQDINGLCYVSGVFQSLPVNSTIEADLLLSYQWFRDVFPSSGWRNSSPRTYVRLKKDTNIIPFKEKIKGFIKAKDNDSQATLIIQKYSDHYLYGNFENGIPAGGRIEYVKLFSIIAIFILSIACINFMNLSTAKASRKLKEVGIKKAIGANRKTLALQYISESIVIAFLALIIAILLIILLLPQFSEITGKQLEINFTIDLITSVLGITFVTGLIAGSYPAFYLSGFNPIVVLKGKLAASGGDQWIRRVLVIFQFTISVILIVSVLVVYKQITYIQTKTLGYERDHVIHFRTENMSNTFLSSIKNTPGVINAGGGNLVARNSHGGTTGIEWEGKNPDDKTFFLRLWVSYHLIETLGMEMAAGQPFSEDFGSPLQIIFNEQAIEDMELKDPIGQIVKFEGKERRIVGVVKNFHYESLYEKVKPCAILLAPMKYAPRISVKIQSGTEKSTIENLKKIYQAHNPDLIFDYTFMDDDYHNLYMAEQRISILSRYFAGITILISCLGLFGLAAFTAERRLKEIGIRKILGASGLKVITLLSKDFTVMVLMSLLISLPVSYFLATRWLNGFAFRVDVNIWWFLSSGLLALIIAWLTVGFQTYKAAMLNPVDCLKNE